MAPQASTQLEIQKIDVSEDCSFKMVKVEGGTFMMGDDKGAFDREKPSHPVQLDSFWLGQHLVSQNLWQEIMGTNPAHFRGLSRPVDRVTWYECIEFCNALSLNQGLSPVYKIEKDRTDPNNNNYFDDLKWLVTRDPFANGFRLPKEAEWEYAAKGATFSFDHIFAGGNTIENLVWFGKNSSSNSHPSSMKVPNSLGLYDMTGNLREWCWDWFDKQYYQACSDQGTTENPLGPQSSNSRVLRGGCWYDNASYCRVAFRYQTHPDSHVYYIGFRLARTAL